MIRRAPVVRQINRTGDVFTFRLNTSAPAPESTRPFLNVRTVR